MNSTMQNYIIGMISSISNDFKRHVDDEWKKKSILNSCPWTHEPQTGIKHRRENSRSQSLACNLFVSSAKRILYPVVIETNINPEQREEMENDSWGVEFDGSNNSRRIAPSGPLRIQNLFPRNRWIYLQRFVESSSILP